MKDAGNPTRWQVAGVALAASVIAAGLAFAAPTPRLAVGGDPGDVVRTVEESPERRARLAEMVRRAETAHDEGAQEPSAGGDGTHRGEEDETAESLGDEPARTEPAPSGEDPTDEDAPVEEDPPTQDRDDEAGDADGRVQDDLVEDPDDSDGEGHGD